MADRVEELYGLYKADNATKAGSLQQFKNNLYGPNYRAMIYNDLKKQGADVGTYEEFSSYLGYSTERPHSEVKPPKNWGTYDMNSMGSDFMNKNVNHAKPNAGKVGQTPQEQGERITRQKSSAPVLAKHNKDEFFTQTRLAPGSDLALDYGYQGRTRKVQDDINRAAEELNKQIVEAAASKVDTKNDALWKQYLKNNIAPTTNELGMLSTVKEANEQYGIGKSMNEVIKAFSDGYFSPKAQRLVEAKARQLGVDPGEIWKHMMPGVEQAVRDRYVNREMPVNDFEYALRGISNSVIGGIGKRMALAHEDRDIISEGEQKYGEDIERRSKENGFWSGATAGKYGNIATGMASDILAFYGAGKMAGSTIGGLAKGLELVTRTPVGKRVLGNVIGKSAAEITEKYGAAGAARILNFVGSNKGFMGTLLTDGAKGMLQSGLTLGNYGAIQYLAGEGVDKIQKGETDNWLGGLLKNYDEQFKTGLKFGMVGAVGGAVGRGVGINGMETSMLQRIKHGVEKTAVTTGAFIAESLAFRTEQMADEWAKDKKIDFVDNFVQGACENLTMKLSGGHWGQFKPKNILRSMVMSGKDARLVLNDAEKKEFLANTNAKNLMDACDALHPDRRTYAEAGEKSRNPNAQRRPLGGHDAEGNAVSALQKFLDDKSVSRRLREKVSAALGGTLSREIPRLGRVQVIKGDDGRYNVREYSSDNELLSVDSYYTEDEANAAKQGLYQKQADRDFRDSYQKAINTFTTDDKAEIFGSAAEALGYRTTAEMFMDAESSEEAEKQIDEAIKKAAARKAGEKAQIVLDLQREINEEFGVDIDKVLDKHYTMRSDNENRALAEFKTRMEDLYMDRDNEEGQRAKSKQDGADIAEQGDVEDSEDFTQRAAAVNERRNKALKVWQDIVAKTKGLWDWLKNHAGGKVDDMRDEFGDEVADAYLETANAEAMTEGFMEQTRQKISDRAEEQTREVSFRGTIDGNDLPGKVIVVTDGDGRMYTILEGDLKTGEEGKLEINAGAGMAVLVDENGELWTYADLDAFTYEILDKEEYKQVVEQRLQEEKTEEIQASEEPMSGEEAAQPGAVETAPHEEGEEPSPQPSPEGEGEPSRTQETREPSEPGRTQETTEPSEPGRTQETREPKEPQEPSEPQGPMEEGEKPGGVGNGSARGREPQEVQEVQEPQEVQKPQNPHEGKLKFRDGTEVPLDEKGNPDFGKMTAEHGAELYNDTFGDDAENVINDDIKEAEKKLKDAQKLKIKGKDWAEKAHSKKERDEAIASAQQKIDSLGEIKKRLEAEKVAEAVGDGGVGNAAARGGKAAGEVLHEEGDNAQREKRARKRFKEAPKVKGRHGTMTLPDGSEIDGTYYVVPAESLTPTHDPFDGFRQNADAPRNEDGSTRNDRDYEHESRAQATVIEHANKYNGLAVSNMPVVLSNGLVVSGNERTMAGQLAAKNGTDSAYKESLKKNAEGYGLKAEDIDKVENGRLVFVPDVDLPYTTETFKKFNGKTMKEQGSIETAVAFAKTLKPEEIGTIVTQIDGDGSLEAFFNNPKATNDFINTLVKKSVISINETPALIDKDGKLSPRGKELVKDLLIGSVFKPETISAIGNDSALKTKVVNGIRAIMENLKKGKYALKEEIDEAVRLLAEARQYGMTVDNLLNQRDAFREDASERYSRMAQAIAQTLEGNATLFRDLMRKYNEVAEARKSSSADMFAGEVSKEELVKDFLETSKLLKENSIRTYGREQEESTGRKGGDNVSGDERAAGGTEGGAEKPGRGNGAERGRANGNGAVETAANEGGKPSPQPSPEGEGEPSRAQEATKPSEPSRAQEARDANKPSEANGQEEPQKPDEAKKIDTLKPAKPAGTGEQREKNEETAQPGAVGNGSAQGGEGQKPGGTQGTQKPQGQGESEELGGTQGSGDGKPWKEMTGAERMAIAEQDPLTEEEIRTKVSDENKELVPAALAYLNGNKNFVNSVAYITIYGDVRNRHENVPGDRGTEDGTQLAATDNGGGEGLGLGTGREGGRPAGPVDTGAGEGTAPGKREGGTNGEGGADTPAGTEGDRKGKGGASGVGGLPAGDTKSEGSGATGGTGDMGGRGRRGRGSRPAGKNGQGDTKAQGGTARRAKTKAELKKETADAKAALKAAFAEMRRRGKGSASISLVGMNSEQVEYVPELMKATGQYGMALINEGIYRAKEWAQNIREAVFGEMKGLGFKDTDVDEYIREMWHMPWSIDGETHTLGEWTSVIGYRELREKLKEPLKKKFDAQVAAEFTEVKVGDRDNIAETLPFLLPQQQDDVLKAETQFFDGSHKDKAHANGKGYMFTNGTGTGKTYTGLGIVKRLVKQGKGRILIVTPSQTKVSDWIKDGKNLCLDIRDLDSISKETGNPATFEKGDGVVITTFANFGVNKRLLEDQFDAVIYDESHRIMENKEGTETSRSRQHYMLTNRNERYALQRLEAVNEDYQKMVKLGDDFNNKRAEIVAGIEKKYREEHPGATDRDVRNAVRGMWPKDIPGFSLAEKQKFPELGKIYDDYVAARQYYTEKVRPELQKQTKGAVEQTKVVFLSATPFNTRESIEYAEGYLFSYPEENAMGQDGRTQFFLDHFGAGYKYRYHRLENAVSNPEALVRQEIAFSDWLQKGLGTMSGRVIDSPYDYSRDFPKVSLDQADAFNAACEEISRDKLMGPIYQDVLGNYNYGQALFETIKVAAALPRIRQHLAMGRKVVIFHRRVESKEPLKAPFEYMLGEKVNEVIKNLPENERPEAVARVQELRQKYAGLLNWEQTLDYRMPREQLAKAFGEDNVLFFGGKENKAAKNKAVAEFNDDNSGKNIIVIQEASGKEGISLHDTTGKHQRVCITLALPQSPITILQIEGRTYRIGNESNAIFEYPVLGLNSEYDLFARKFNNQVSTTENLALGSQARNLRESFARGIEESSDYVPLEQQGVGGKQQDAPIEGDETDGFDKAVLDYYSNQKLSRNNREGVDYFPTPEPLGYKLMEWANVDTDDSILEPSAGHGAIARYAPAGNSLTAIEPSLSLFAKLQIRAGGNGRKFQNDVFENYHISNKHDVVVMNPPFGKAGATAIAHVDKAFDHLEEGGRVVAIIPRGATDKKFENWIGEKKGAVLRAEVDLPDITFQQAGTSVRCRVVVVDKVTDAKLREGVGVEKVDLSGHYDKVEDFFEDLRNVEMPERIIDYKAKLEKKSKTAAAELKKIRGTRVYLSKEGIDVYSHGQSACINFIDRSNKARNKEYLAEKYDMFAQSARNFEGMNEKISAMYSELRDLACKLAGMTEDEMQRYLRRKERGDEGDVRFRKVEDEGELAELNKGKTFKMYSAMQEVDGKFYSPMAAIIDGKRTDASEPGAWMRADEHPELVKDGKFTLVKTDKKKRKGEGNVDAAYNPYMHTSSSVMNDQFTGAYARGNIKVVEWEIPESEKTSGYKAEGAKDSEGMVSWHSGPVNSLLPKERQRQVMLSRHRKMVRIIPDKEVAERVAAQLKGTNLAIPWNVFTPNQIRELAKLGVPITTVESGTQAKETKLEFLKQKEELEREFPQAKFVNVKMTQDAHKEWGDTGEVLFRKGETLADRRRRNAAARGGQAKPQQPRTNGGVGNAAARGGETKGETPQEEAVQARLTTGAVETAPHKEAGGTAALSEPVETGSHEEGARTAEVGAVEEMTPREMTPREREEKVVRERRYPVVEKAVKELNTDVTTHDSVDSIENAAVRRAIERGEKVKAWFDVKTGEVHLYMPNTTDKYDAQKSIAHEVIGHKGMRGLLGEEGYKDMMRRMYTHMTNEEVEEVNRRMMRNGWDFYTAMDEYVADRAEDMVWNPKAATFWENVKHYVTEAINRAGYHINPNVDDVKYWLWESKRALQDGDAYTEMKRNAFRYKLSHANKVPFDNMMQRAEAQNIPAGETDHDRMVAEAEVLYRKNTLDPQKGDTPLLGGTKEAIESAMRTASFRRTECWVDSKHGLKVTQDIMGKGLKKPMDSSMDAYHGAINQSSIVSEKQHNFEKEQMAKLSDNLQHCTQALGGGDKGYAAVSMYAYVKSGLERNRVLYVRDVANLVDEQVAKLNKAEALKAQANNSMPALVDIDGVKEYRDAFHDEKSYQEAQLRAGKINLQEYYDALDTFVRDFQFSGTGNPDVDAQIDKLNEWYEKKVGNKYNADKNDYSGIHSIEELKDANGNASDAVLIDHVMQTENTIGEDGVNDLWDSVKGVTQHSLDNEYNYGNIDRATYNRTSRMFTWYLPMRGFKNDANEDVYGYMRDDMNGDGGSIVKGADGRTTLGENPFGTACSMAERSIARGENNRNKQRLYKLVTQWIKDHSETDADGNVRLTEEAPAMVSDVWYVKKIDKTTGEEYWEAELPNLKNMDSPTAIRRATESFVKEMGRREKEGTATKMVQKGRIDKPFKASEHKNEHIVYVNVGGKQKMIIFPGNPRAAQAINGDLENDARTNKMMRAMAAAFTSYNVTFVVTNTARDTMFANNNIAIRENSKYYVQFARNQAMLIGSMARGLLTMNAPKAKGKYFELWTNYNKGLPPRTELEKHFRDFMENGGKTGFVKTRTISDLEAELRNSSTRSKVEENIKKAMKSLPEVIEEMNARAENMNRFAAYLTSRQMGRSIMRSVSDAKEVSTNFNRRGSGSKAYKGTEAPWYEKTQGVVYDWCKSAYLFFNAGMQSLALTTTNFKKHPVKTSVMTVGVPMVVGGLIVPMLNQWIASALGEDEDEYANLPEWDRRNNICVYTGKGKWVKVPLPIELRAFYGLGDVALGMKDARFRSVKGSTFDALGQLTQAMPLDFLGEGGDVMGATVPDIVKPLYHIMKNEDWTGKPLYKDTEWNKFEPEWQKAYKGENELLVGTSRLVNKMSGGTDHTKGSIDCLATNPAVWSELLSGYFGGAGSDAMRMVKLGGRAINGNFEDFSTREIPMVRALYNTSTEKTQYYRALNKYYKYKEDADKYEHDLKAWSQDDDPVVRMRAIRDIKEGSPELRRAIMIKNSETVLSRLKKVLKYGNLGDKEKAQLEKDMNEIRKSVVDEIER